MVEIRFAKREHGRSSYNLGRLARVAMDGMFFRTTLLLRLVVLLGVLVALSGAALAAYNVVYYFVASQPLGYTSLVVLVLLSSGFIILSVGIVGLYVGRVFEQVKFRPLFIISRSAGAGLEDDLTETTPVPALAPRRTR